MLFPLKIFKFEPMYNEFLVCLYCINRNTSFVSLILLHLAASSDYSLFSICVTPPNCTDIFNCISLKPFNKCELKKFLYLVSPFVHWLYFLRPLIWGVVPLFILRKSRPKRKKLNIKSWKLSAFPRLTQQNLW